MPRVAYLRSIEIQQAAPYLTAIAPFLRSAGVQARLFHTDGTCTAEDFPGSWQRLPSDVLPGPMAEAVLAWGADAVVSLSLPDEHALRDAVVREKLAGHGVPTVMHDLETTGALANKWATKELMARHGITTPPGLLLDGDLLNGRGLAVPAYREYLQRQGHELGFPLLVKPLWDCLGNGFRYIPDATAWSAYLDTPHPGNVLIERCLEGELCSVEVVGTAGEYVVQPLLWKGTTGGPPSFAFREVRYSGPRPGEDERFEPVARQFVELCRALDTHGCLEIEMIYTDGVYHVIEINPRISGSTSLSIATSGYNTFQALTEMALGTWHRPATGNLLPRRRFVAQVPLRAAPPDPEGLAAVVDVVRSNTFHVDGVEYANMLLTCPLDDLRQLPVRLSEVRARWDLVTRGTIARVREALRLAEPAPAI